MSYLEQLIQNYKEYYNKLQQRRFKAVLYDVNKDDLDFIRGQIAAFAHIIKELEYINSLKKDA